MILDVMRIWMGDHLEIPFRSHHDFKVKARHDIKDNEQEQLCTQIRTFCKSHTGSNILALVNLPQCGEYGSKINANMHIF